MAQYDHLQSSQVNLNTPQHFGGGGNYGGGNYGGTTGASPYGSGDPYYNQSTGYITPQPAKKGVSNWVKFGIPIGILVIAGAVVGGIFGARHHNASSGSGSASAAANAKNDVGLFATATNSEFMMPIYPSTVSRLFTFAQCLYLKHGFYTNTAAYGSPTYNAGSDSAPAWPEDSFKPSNPSPTSVRSDRPRLIAPSYKWDALPNLISKDPYLKYWNETIFSNASDYYNAQPVTYFMDGPSGILDNAREIKMRVKAFSYAYRMTKDTKWVDRTFRELQVSVGIIICDDRF